MSDTIRDLRQQVANLQKKVDVEIPQGMAASLEAGFKDIISALEMRLKQVEQPLPSSTTSQIIPPGQQKPGNGIQGIIETISGIVNNVTGMLNKGAPAAGSEITAFDKDIQLMSRQLISLTYKKALKDFATSAGMPLPAPHVVVEPP